MNAWQYLILLLSIAIPWCYIWYQDQQSHKQDYLNHPYLSNCSVSDPRCFNLSKCFHTTKIYIYKRKEGSWLENNYIVQYFLSNQEEIRKFNRRIENLLESDPTLSVTKNPKEACLFVPRIACLSVNQCDLSPIFTKTRLQSLPYWNNGQNHIVFDHGDDEFQYGTSSGTGTEMRIRSASSLQYYRKDFDIGISLRPKISIYSTLVTTGRQHIASNRPLLIGFLGAPTTTSGLRQSLLELHSLTEGIDIQVRAPKCKVPCLRHEPKYYDAYRSILLRSTFQLVPRGQGLHSHRLLESIAAGSIPIVLADNIILPFSEYIPWSNAIVIVAEKDWKAIPTIVEKYIEKINEMQCWGLAIYRHFFLRPFGTIGLSFRILQRRIRKEVKRRRKDIVDNNNQGKLTELIVPWPYDKPIPRQPSFCTKEMTLMEDVVRRINEQ